MGRGKDHPTYRGKCSKACETCRRRKERCDGRQPCGRCISRNVAFECQPAQRRCATRSRDAPSIGHQQELQRQQVDGDVAFSDGVDDGQSFFHHMELQSSSHPADDTCRSRDLGGSPSASAHHHMSRLLRDSRGKYMFIGDSANLSFLQSIRKVVEDAIGHCAFAKDPLRYQMLEAAPDGRPNWLYTDSKGTPPTPTLVEAEYLVRSYFLANNCVLDLFDEADLFKNLQPWLERKSAETDALTPIYYLVFALGAQTCPDDKDQLAETYFSYGRYFTAVSFAEDPSISTVQAYAMITMYLLGASRRNAAFMNLGTAVRAAYALGLHRKEIAALFTPGEFRTRERLWKVIRILDVFMSASLGRPPSTAETRDTRSEDNYSASVDLCTVFETIMNEVYSKRMISNTALEKISEHQRHWAANFHKGLDEDGIKPTPAINGGKSPNIGLMHVKGAYYWTIILLTRPFLVDAVSSYIATANVPSAEGNSAGVTSYSDKVLVHACVDSAIRTIELLRILLDFNNVPKRLPFLVNYIFVAALVLGLAHFGDVAKIFPVGVHLKLAHRLLAMFPKDAISSRNTTIVEYLLHACDTVAERRTKWDRDRCAVLVRGMFGKIHDDPAPSAGLYSASPTAHMSTTTARSSTEPSHQMDQSLQLPLEEGNQHGDTAQYDPMSQTKGLISGAAAGCARPRDKGRVGPSAPTEEASMTQEEFEKVLQAMSPTTLWFESYDDNFPLFSTTDAPTT
ncbi:uncharacterized protein Z519_08946 [Cladophialophora bantiana CBS 173.52]|uniref:Zn(2)-C6 fungal-type domain-containing protein n=1 Tax=Cladophialophora bantiana (strain ATCC 10958 / CBS 173.52 / CDC B-1940 / NIH 8579) TaxID=1442370 RepID=A0A0D2FUS9_CLAB1|nr:uncharacterized protein Z519_08946 [Cladophialophora bantiana CBS 173.52]KIW90302.1 hypothetical protein Z519_08946 [Cladophialophora bantiana CBS 173.52]